MWHRRLPVELKNGKSDVNDFYTQGRNEFVIRLYVSVFNVASMTTDLIEYVYFELTYKFHIFHLSICANYVNMLRK
jgi:hypothetical protein